MKKICTILFCLCAAYLTAATLSGSVDITIRSDLTGTRSMGTPSDRVDETTRNYFILGERHGAIDEIYRADRVIGSATPDVLRLVGSLTNAIGDTISMSVIKAVYIENLTGTGTLTISGVATATVQPWGSFFLIGSQSVASSSDRLTVATTATTTYRVWIVGNR